MIAYRLEHKEYKCGIYRLHDAIRSNTDTLELSIMIGSAHGDYSHPAAWEDIMGWDFDEHKDYICAYPSLNGLREWFTGYLNDIIKLGFVINVYDAGYDYMEGQSGKQIAFNKTNAKLVKTINEKDLTNYKTTAELIKALGEKELTK